MLSYPYSEVFDLKPTSGSELVHTRSYRLSLVRYRRNRVTLPPELPGILGLEEKFREVANFRPGAAVEEPIRLPQELVAAAGLTGGELRVRLLLDCGGACSLTVAKVPATQIVSDGFLVSVSNQSSYVYDVVP